MNMRQADRVVRQFRKKKLKPADIARLAGWPYGKLQYARRVGYFQPRDLPKLLEIAAANDVDLSAEDLVAHLA